MSIGQNELILEFKMAIGNAISIEVGFKRELVRSGMDCEWNG